MKITRRQLRKIILQEKQSLSGKFLDWAGTGQVSFDNTRHPRLSAIVDAVNAAKDEVDYQTLKNFLFGINSKFANHELIETTRDDWKRIVKEAIQDDFFSDREASPHDESMYGEPEGGYDAGYEVGSLVRSVDYQGDGWGGDYERSVGDQIGTIVEVDDDIDGTQYVVNWPNGEPTMVTADELELVKENKMRITKRQLKKIIREALEHEDPEVIRAAEAIAAAIDGSNIKKGAPVWAFDDVISNALSDFGTDKDFLKAVEKHFYSNKKAGLYSDRAHWAAPAYIGSKIAWSTPGFADARRYADVHGS